MGLLLQSEFSCCFSLNSPFLWEQLIPSSTSHLLNWACFALNLWVFDNAACLLIFASNPPFLGYLDFYTRQTHLL